jgi:uncharacterized membrane protein YphA (DoxX/SURF4 family)
MSAVAALGLVWAVAGVVLLARWWGERGTDPSPRGRWELPPGTRFGRPQEDGSRRRFQAMRLTYAIGTTLVAVGFLTRWAAALALGALAVNLGTLQRFLAEVTDLGTLDRPVLPRRSRPSSSAPSPRHALVAKPRSA